MDKKTAFIPPWDKSHCFCDTTQIDACAPTRLRVPSYASRWITGGIPVGPYLESLPFGPPSEVHSTAAPCPAPTIRDSLKVRCTAYFSPS